MLVRRYDMAGHQPVERMADGRELLLEAGRWQRNRKFDSALIAGDSEVAERPELAAGDSVGQRDGIPAERVDVVETERGQPRHVFPAHVVGLGLERIQRRVHIDGVPAHDDVHHEAERAELFLLAFSVARPQAARFTAEDDAGKFEPAPSRLSWATIRRRYASSSMNRSR